MSKVNDTSARGGDNRPEDYVQRDHSRQYAASYAFEAVLNQIEARHVDLKDLLVEAESAANEMLLASEEEAHRDALAGLGVLEGSMTWPEPDQGDAYTLGAIAALSGLSATLYFEFEDGTRAPVDYVECHEGQVVIRYEGAAIDALDLLRSRASDLERRMQALEDSAA